VKRVLRGLPNSGWLGAMLLIAVLSLAAASPAPCEEKPKGTLAFSSTREGNTDIYTSDASGSNLVRVTTGSTSEIEPSWSPDGNWIAYQSRRPSWRIFAARATGEDETALTRSLNWSPAWSPDGGSIAYSSGSSILRVSNTGESLPDLCSRCGSCGRPAWSPDGGAIAFHSNMDGDQDIYALSLEDGSLVRVTDHTALDFQASWSPDGASIALASDRDGDLDIYTIRLDGTGLRQLTDDPGEDILPAWSPDGEWIAFVSTRDGNREIYTMRIDGSCVNRVTENPGEDMYPAWKPN